MFTGIISHLGTVVAHERRGSLSRLHLSTGGAAADLADGGSLAVDGVCLTALAADLRVAGADFVADVVAETLDRTTIGTLAPGARINLERCLTATGRFDGHIVQGHVDGVGRILDITADGDSARLRVGLPAGLGRFVVEKGSIALNGVSLTIAAVGSVTGDAPGPGDTAAPSAEGTWVEVALIPATLDLTTFRTARAGDGVNVEIDVLAKHAAALTRATAAGSNGDPDVGAPPPATAAGLASAPANRHNVDAAVRAIAAGRPVIVVDDEDRENEGDLILAAELATPEWLGFVVRFSSGVLCAPMTPERAAALDLPPMVADNEDPKGTAYTVSCDARAGTSTGISAADRAATLRVLADPRAVPGDLSRPGHVFPLVARPGGLAEREGHTEAAVELMALAGLERVGVIAEIVHDDGSMMRRPALEDFAAAHELPLVSIEALQAHVREEPELARPSSPSVGLPTAHGMLSARSFRFRGVDYAVLSAPADDLGAPLVRVHSECLTGDVFGSRRCDCGEQRDAALAHIAAHGGTLIYMTGHEGRGIGLAQKLAAYQLQDSGLDTVDANLRLGHEPDERDYVAAAAILRALDQPRIRLLSNNPAKAEALGALGIEVEGLLGLEIPAREENRRYLGTKRERMRHSLRLD